MKGLKGVYCVVVNFSFFNLYALNVAVSNIPTRLLWLNTTGKKGGFIDLPLKTSCAAV
jgi:hypothetical protein